jgi:hypothetical protein
VVARIADALEHLAYPQFIHSSGQCEICRLKAKPVRKMMPSRVLTPAELKAHEQRIRQARMMAGPEQPVGDMFRYRELKRSDT